MSEKLRGSELLKELNKCGCCIPETCIRAGGCCRWELDIVPAARVVIHGPFVVPTRYAESFFQKTSEQEIMNGPDDQR